MSAIPLIDPDASARISQPRDLGGASAPAPASSSARVQCKIAGYQIENCIGAGGYGEVWKASAPGGLQKAVKFVYGRLDDARAACELEALNRIKEVRHPFLLSLERIEVLDGQLVIVTELADKSIKDRFDECLDQGCTGISRDELLLYLSDAAEALDYMCARYSLQHLDVKPENLLILAGRVKVADFGLVRQVQDKTVTMMGGLTPAYAPPESFRGHPCRQSDQYSLAIVYQEMLTGILPFPGRTALQLAEQHQHSPPFLASLPLHDRAIIERALSKEPSFRFASCRDMVQALRNAGLPGGPRGEELILEDPLHDTNTIALDTNEARPSTGRPAAGAAPGSPERPSTGRPPSGRPASGQDPTCRLTPVGRESAASDPRSMPNSMPPLVAGQGIARSDDGPRASGAAGTGSNPASRFATEQAIAAPPQRAGVDSPASGSESLQPHEIIEALRASEGGASALCRSPARPETRRTPTPKPRKAPILREDSHTAWRPTESLPAVELRAEQKLRPTLVIGIGGIAGRVLRRFRGNVATRFGSMDAVPIWQMLLLDSDRQALSHVARGSDSGALAHDQMLAIPLRPAQEYRNGSSDLLRWISRRWLYNIPRSLLTEGIRPLGRLALVDQIQAIRARLGRMIETATARESINMTQGQTAIDVCEDSIRVFIVAATCGGTGGGAMIDVAQLTRHLLREAGHTDIDLTGLMLHATPRDPNRAELAIANTCATLAELAHFDSQQRYPGDAACGLPVYEGTTFENPYFLHLGDHLDDLAMAAATDRVAEYVYLNTASRSGRFFDYCRDPRAQAGDVVPVESGENEGGDKLPDLAVSGGDRAQGPLMLRSFGLRTLGFSHGALPEAAAAVLCGELVRRWRGQSKLTAMASRAAAEIPEPRPEAAAPAPAGSEAVPPSRTAKLLGEADAWAETQSLTLPGLLKRAEQCAAEAQGKSPETVIAELLTVAESQDDIRAGLTAIDESLGPIQEAGDAERTPKAELSRAILQALANDSLTLGRQIRDYILSLANDTAIRVTGAERVADRFTARFNAVIEEASNRMQKDHAAVAEAIHLHGRKRSVRGGLLKMLSGGKKETSRFWDRVIQLRYEMTALEIVRRWARKLQAHVREARHQLVSMTRELDVLIDQFNVTDRWKSMARGLDDEDHLPSAEDELRRMVIDTLRDRLPELAARLDNEFKTTYFGDNNGLVDVLERGDIELPDAAMAAARSAVFGVLEEIDVANLLLPNALPADLPEQLVRCVREAEPVLMNCGGARRLLLIHPRGTSGPALRETISAAIGEPLSVVANAGGDLVLCHELESLDLAAVLHYLAGSRNDYFSAAARLHTRIDIDWRPIVEG